MEEKTDGFAAVDLGNTAVKVWMDGELRMVESRPTVGRLAAALEGAKTIVWWATREPEAQMVEILGPNRVLGTTPGVLVNAYRTPETLGADRWAAVNGAYHWSRRENGTAVLVVGAGTALTYDFATDFVRRDDGGFDDRRGERAVYWGGGIAPGMRMRFKALHQ
ncbi:MAG: type III pantothenate kinase, partial [Bacteroidia bacterium]|nr:type III pantothenate kinase [Bacteroidia bacterium]